MVVAKTERAAIRREMRERERLIGLSDALGLVELASP